ncbi:phycobilisome degradation protein nblA [Moorena producens PAL-8-15-08-1]|uniref:Phycobilisome degradation protein nblA n=1 Tax=Moorena producens PAL-8-15-08-1 TaxID=1458985 RepID=A0A1D8U2M2_9CYAN|nr:NblA/ycf18 family protein [Moorena producens]AOX04024.1 phycobilisome degradation protein nblA [Moorena producens PAL-8-15-08-1]
MKYSEQLSLEQEFNLRIFADQVLTLSLEQAQDLSIELYRQMMLKDNMYEDLLKDYWNMSEIPLYF